MRNHNFRLILIFLLILFCQPVLVSIFPVDEPPLASAFADDWKKEFEDVCAKTDIAMSLTKEELKQLITRCDELKAAIEKQGESEKKVYLRRLRLCRNLFAFVLESKEKE